MSERKEKRAISGFLCDLLNQKFTLSTSLKIMHSIACLPASLVFLCLAFVHNLSPLEANVLLTISYLCMSTYIVSFGRAILALAPTITPLISATTYTAGGLGFVVMPF